MNIQGSSVDMGGAESHFAHLQGGSNPMWILHSDSARESLSKHDSAVDVRGMEIYSADYLMALLGYPNQVCVTCTNGQQCEDTDLRSLLDALDSCVSTQIVRLDWSSMRAYVNSSHFENGHYHGQGDLTLKTTRSNEFVGWLNDQLRTLNDWGMAFSECFEKCYHDDYYRVVLEHLKSIRLACNPRELSHNKPNCPSVHQISQIDISALSQLAHFFRSTKFPDHQWLEEKFWVTFCRGLERHHDGPHT